ncbi:hypothetical protein FQA39_LY01450 [Lamprigera yunnana]|nr:hypothetical protein FQA39_LY01450 [Lamprigera yunnana]
MALENIREHVSTRYLLAVLGSMAMAIVYGLKVNLSVAIVSMVNHTATTSGEDAHDSDPSEDGPFIWPGTIQGLLKSAYFWGYLVAQLPAARIAELFSAKWVMFFSVFINVICTLLSPVCAKAHYGWFLFMRILEGVGGGVTFPGMHVLLAHWAPPSERSVMSSIVYAGTALGTVIFTLVTGLIAGKYGWEAIFYIEGSASAVWLLMWVLLTADSPEQHKFITETERTMITSSLSKGGEDSEHKKLSVPWKSVFTSPAFLAILVTHTCCNWGWYMVLIELPHYMSTILKYQITQNAVVSSIPYFTMWLFSIVLSKTLDILRGKNKITTTTARKISTLVATIFPLICFLAICYIGTDKVAVTILMTLAITAIGGMFSGYLSNHIDIAPNFAGTLVALTNTAATIPGKPAKINDINHPDWIPNVNMGYETPSTSVAGYERRKKWTEKTVTFSLSFLVWLTGFVTVSSEGKEPLVSAAVGIGSTESGLSAATLDPTTKNVIDTIKEMFSQQEAMMVWFIRSQQWFNGDHDGGLDQVMIPMALLLTEGQMDPWATFREQVIEANPSVNSDNYFKFEDNFKPLVSDTLPDSKEYLAALENKLAKLKSDPNILKQLADKREACMQQLLSADYNTVVGEQSFDTPVENSTILRTIAPEKQALTEGERVTLIEYDQLVDNETDLTPEKVIVTGASQGIGRTIAIETSKNLSKHSLIVLLARSEDGLKETQRLITEFNNEVTVKIFPLDLTKPNLNMWADLIDPNISAERAIIFHNAGQIGILKKARKLTNIESWRDYFDLNVFSVGILNSFLMNKFKNKKLLIVNITSLCGRQPFKDLAMYGSAKAARDLYFRVLALEEPDVTVLNYSPGPVDTDMVDKICVSAESEETRDMFLKCKSENTILTTIQTITKLLRILKEGNFTSGDIIDYYDENTNI